MTSKVKTAVSVDPDLLDAARRHGWNVSELVSDAIRARLDHEARLAAGRELLAHLDEEFGPVDDATLEAAAGVLAAAKRAVAGHDPSRGPIPTEPFDAVAAEHTTKKSLEADLRVPVSNRNRRKAEVDRTLAIEIARGKAQR